MKKIIAMLALLITACYLCTLKAETSQQPQQKPPSPPEMYNPSWSPDGGRLIIEARANGGSGLFVINDDGSGRRPLSNFRSKDSNGVWSPDGRRVAFVSDRDGGNLHVFVMDADGRNPVKVTTDPGLQDEARWSPDGERLAFVTKPTPESLQRIGIINLKTGEKTILGDPATDEMDPSWSPDGRHIIFSSDRSGTREIYVMNADGSGIKALTANSNSDEPAWSSRGSVAFRSNRDGNAEIYVMNGDGTNVRRLTKNPGHDWMPTWSPDGKLIAFASNRSGQWAIYVMGANGDGVNCVGGGVGGNCGRATETVPAFSPDGKSIAFVAVKDGARFLSVVGVDGTGLRRIVELPGNSYGPPAWSADGRTILLGIFTPTSSSIRVVDVATGSMQDMPGLEVADHSAAWSPDGKHLVLASGPRNQINLYTMNANGEGRRPLTSMPGPIFNGGPSWSRLGEIVFASLKPGPDSTIGLVIVHDDGSGLRSLPTSSIRADSPAWSPDGKRVAFQAHVVGNDVDDIFVINADGSGERRLTNHPGWDETPSWSPDGSLIAFASDRGGAKHVYVMRPDGTNLRRVTKEK